MTPHRTTEEVLVDKLTEMRKLLSVCVRRLGGHVVLTPDDNDWDTRGVLITKSPQHAYDLRAQYPCGQEQLG